MNSIPNETKQLTHDEFKLVKDDICEYNVKEAINIANKIEDFNYPEYKEELENKLKNM